MRNFRNSTICVILTAIAAFAFNASPSNAKSMDDHAKIQCFIVSSSSNPYDLEPCTKIADNDDNEQECEHHNGHEGESNDSMSDDHVNYDADHQADDNADADNENEQVCPPATPPVTPVAPQTGQQQAPNTGASTTPAVTTTTVKRTYKVYCLTDIVVHLSSRNMQVFGFQSFRINGTLVAMQYVPHARSSITIQMNLPAFARKTISKFNLTASTTFNKHGHIVKPPHSVWISRCAKYRAPQRQVYMTDAPRHPAPAPEVVTLTALS